MMTFETLKFNNKTKFIRDEIRQKFQYKYRSKFGTVSLSNIHVRVWPTYLPLGLPGSLLINRSITDIEKKWMK